MGGIGKWAWRWSRLRAMGPRELAWRSQEHIRQWRETRRAGREAFHALEAPRGAELRQALSRSLAPLVPPPSWREQFPVAFPRSCERLGRLARAALEGRVAIFARDAVVGRRVDWHRDPLGEHRAPARAAAAVDYRDPHVVGSARRIWELNRHHYLTEAALWAWWARDGVTAALVVEQLRDWCEANPPLWGINWTSSLELAIRTLAWTEIVALLLDLGDQALGDETLELLVGAWSRQIEHVRAHDSRYSSANNHRIGEAAAVWVAGWALPFHPHSAEWRQWGRTTLGEELPRQMAPDGAGREQAFAYQRFVLDFTHAARVMARGHGEDLSEEAIERSRRATAFLFEVTRADGRVFSVGDDDEGRVLALGESFEERTVATLVCAAWLHREPDWFVEPQARAHWLGLVTEETENEARSVIGAEEEAISVKGTDSPLTVRVYPEGGYALVRSGGGLAGSRLLFDAGPLGFGTLAAHGHPDALSICLWAGEDVLVDPGTGSYHGDPEWRERLRSTGAHNTCEIDGQDQSEPRGLFLWGRKAQSRLMAAGGNGRLFVLAGQHDGYAHLGIDETRRVVLGSTLEGGWQILVVDSFWGKGAHHLRSPWHVGEGRPHLVEDGSVPLWQVIYPGGVQLQVRAIGLGGKHSDSVLPLRPHAWVGGEGPDGAWYAPRFEEKEPEGRLEVRLESTGGPWAVAWLFCVEPAGRSLPPGGLSADLCRGGAILGAELAGGRCVRALVASPESRGAAQGGAVLTGSAALWVEGPVPVGDPYVAVASATGLEAGALSWGPSAAPVTGVLSFVPSPLSDAVARSPEVPLS
jgi:hypothetical protein